MRIYTLLFIIFLALAGNASAQNTPTNEYRLYFMPKNLLLCSKKMILLTRNFGQVSLDTVKIDPQGHYYTSCQLRFACSNCKKTFPTFQTFCDVCQSSDFTPESCNPNGDLTPETLIYAYFIDPESWNEELFACSGELDLNAGIDSDGYASLNLDFTIKSDDESLSGNVSGSVILDQAGEPKTEVNAGFKWKF